MRVSAILQIFWAFFNWVIHTVQMQIKALVKFILRSLFSLSSPSLRRQQGFVLPTTVLLLLVVTLAVGSITLRTMNRSGQVSGDRQQRVIYNAATPTIDRAKAKLEYMFDSERDIRYPNGIPDQSVLKAMMLNDGSEGTRELKITSAAGDEVDPYTFPDANGSYDSAEAETRINIDGNEGVDNAWSYEIDLDEDGALDAIVAYSILFETPASDGDNKLVDSSDTAIENRAESLQVRHGPLSVPVKDDGCGGGGGNAGNNNGWSKPEQGGSSLYKNFQVNAIVLPKDPNNTVSTLEFHQDRRIDEGNKWGAWFRNDLEVFPGSSFNWNGAMHTEGSLLAGNSHFDAYLISSPASCYYTRENSEITVADRTTANQDNNFQGQIMSTQVKKNKWSTSEDVPTYHLFDPDGNIPENNMNHKKDSVVEPGEGEAVTPEAYLLDPVVLLTQDVSKSRGTVFASNDPTEDGNPKAERDDAWKESDFLKEGRLYNQTEQTPSVDDSFRADNRYGPKPRISGKTIPGEIGVSIKNDLLSDDGLDDEDLIRLGVASGDESNDFSNVGLDGYWERRARAEGTRVIVGQRLELGNSFGWGGGANHEGDDYIDSLEQEPLMPWNGCSEYKKQDRCAESRQRRTLRDNLAAVQAAAVYHANGIVTNADPDFPLACLASTVHPGTPYTLQNSATFLDWTQGLESAWNTDDFDGIDNTKDLLFIGDFFRGEGTNGWEYETLSDGNPSTFATDIASDQPLGKALRNLAHFAGDQFAGAPSFTPVQDTNVHPYPLLSMWGDFSVLRRIFSDLLDNGVSYNSLSPADKTTLQTAACSLGMLANELYYLEKFDYTQIPDATKYGGSTSESLLDVLDARLHALSTDKNNSSYDSNKTGKPYWAEPPLNQTSGDFAYYNGATTLGENFDGLAARMPPEAFIARLEQWRDADLIAFETPNVSTEPERLQRFNVDDDLINLAKIIMLREQVLRDRTYGFDDNRFSPNCGEFISDAYGTQYFLSGSIESTLCSDHPKFGVLYSVFPGEGQSSAQRDGVIDSDDNHNDDRDARGIDNSTSTNLRNTFNPTYEYSALSADDLDAIRLEPRQPKDWVLPRGALGTVDDTDYQGYKVNPNSSSALYVTCNVELCSSGTSTSSGYESTLYQTQTMEVALKDASFYNGREYLSVRTMDINLDLLRNNNTGLTSSDRWLPNSGIFYAFREDAVREDAITRPNRETWDNCNTDAAYSSGVSDCHMGNLNLAAEASTDPPLSADKKISPKPVDYYADPDRRPHGFRLRNGAKLQRPNDEGRGLSFVSDNSVYIKGDFNLHQTPPPISDSDAEGQPLEEFQDTEHIFTETSADFTIFYKRKTRDDKFSTLTGDEWRPSEILADAVTILSDNFCDGSMFDSFQAVKKNVDDSEVQEVENIAGVENVNRSMNFMSGGAIISAAPWRKLYNCASTAITEGDKEQTSYTNGAFPRVDVEAGHKLVKSLSKSGLEEYWQRENPYDTKSPFSITRQGNPRYPDDGDPFKKEGYFTIASSANKPSRATNTTVNAIIISGIVPSRAKQSYGGLHNFPRFIETWGNQGLRIAGSLMQLSFSNASTSPYDQDAWEPGTAPKDAEIIDHYLAPLRLWGYDVGLQKGVAGPMARRFVSGAEPTRSEFYTEPPADDPYINNLCQGIKTLDGLDYSCS